MSIFFPQKAILSAILGTTPPPPEDLEQRDALEIYMNGIFLNLTGWICKDATIKIWHAERIRDKYINSIGFQLGTITAAIQGHFRQMLEIYKRYGTLKRFRLAGDTISDILDGYAHVKGHFNSIRMEISIYYEVLARYKAAKANITKENITKSELEAILVPKRFRKTTLNVGEEVYKKSLRYAKWSKQWNNFTPEIEGIDIEGVEDLGTDIIKKAL